MNIKTTMVIVTLLILLFVPITFLSCSKSESKSNMSSPLVLRNGLLFKDSLSTTPFTGRNKSKMLDQTIEYDVVDGIKSGDFIIYHKNGKVQMQGTMTNNLNIGEWKYYRIDGTLETIGTFENDTPSGKWQWYYQGGKVAEEGFFNKGLRDGEWKDYDTTGKLAIIIKYKMNTVLDSINMNQ